MLLGLLENIRLIHMLLICKQSFFESLHQLAQKYLLLGSYFTYLPILYILVHIFFTWQITKNVPTVRIVWTLEYLPHSVSHSVLW